MAVLRERVSWSRPKARRAGRGSGGLQDYVDNIPKKVERLDLVANFVEFRVPATQFTSGIRPDHTTSQLAIRTGALDTDFVSELHGWNLTLLHP
jgi:hypothetical protein